MQGASDMGQVARVEGRDGGMAQRLGQARGGEQDEIGSARRPSGQHDRIVGQHLIRLAPASNEHRHGECGIAGEAIERSLVLVEGETALIHQGLRELELLSPGLDILIPPAAHGVHIEAEPRETLHLPDQMLDQPVAVGALQVDEEKQPIACPERRLAGAGLDQEILELGRLEERIVGEELAFNPLHHALEGELAHGALAFEPHQDLGIPYGQLLSGYWGKRDRRLVLVLPLQRLHFPRLQHGRPPMAAGERKLERRRLTAAGLRPSCLLV